MAFGFLVEKFDLFLEIASKSVAGRTLSVGGQMVGNIAGLLLIALGGATMVLSSLWRWPTGVTSWSTGALLGTGRLLN
jgi:putative membrane protein